MVRVCSLRSIFESGHDQLKMQECDLLKIAFILRNGPYEYMVMSFGLTRTPSYYMDLINKDFMEYLDKFIMESINNIFVYSSSKEEHLCLVLQKLQNHRPYAKLSKLFG
jgi:hypothetical protein